jgi:hypothetical protein
MILILALFLVPLVIVMLLMRAICNKVFGAPTIETCSLLVWELALDHFVTFLSQTFLVLAHKESNVLDLLIIGTICRVPKLGVSKTND